MERSERSLLLPRRTRFVVGDAALEDEETSVEMSIDKSVAAVVAALRRAEADRQIRPLPPRADVPPQLLCSGSSPIAPGHGSVAEEWTDWDDPERGAPGRLPTEADEHRRLSSSLTSLLPRRIPNVCRVLPPPETSDEVSGRLLIAAPADARVFVNGVAHGVGTTEVREVGRHSQVHVRVHRRTHGPWSRTVSLNGQEKLLVPAQPSTT